MAFDIVGFDNSYKRPIFAGQIIFGAGNVSAASQPLAVLCIAPRTSGGNLTLDTEIRAITSKEEAITAAGQGSFLYRQLLAALRVPNVLLYAMAVTEASGTAATVTCVISGTWSTAGTLKFFCAGQEITTSIGASDSIDTVGANVVSKWNSYPDLPVTAGYNSGTDTLTFTHRNLGAQGQQQIILQDKSAVPSGFAITLVGSSSFSGDGLFGVRMGAAGSGTGVESLTTLLTAPALVTKRWARIAPMPNDTTNATAFETFVNSQAGPTTLLLENLIYGHNGTQGAATTLAQTDLNAQRAQVVAMRNSEIHPSELAAYVAALRSATEQTDPVPDYDAKVLTGVPPHRMVADIWTPAEENALLNAGVTPVTTVNGAVQITRAITTYCLNGVLQDERTLDIGDAVFPDYALLDLQLLYQTQFRPANKYVRDNPAPGELEPPQGVGYPDLWEADVRKRMSEWFASGWIEDTFSGDNPLLPVAAVFNKVSKRIQSNVPLIVSRVQHQLSAIVRQTST